MTKEINYPEVDTWFICWSNDREVLKAYGVVMPSQTMATYWDVLDTYTNKQDWLQQLTENGIEVNSENFNNN